MAFTGEQTSESSQTLADMGLTPDCRTQGEIKAWMADYVKAEGKVEVKQEAVSQADVEKDHTPVKALYQHQLPRLFTFSGDPSAKGDVQFDLWKYEVDCLLKKIRFTQKRLSKMFYVNL